MKTYTTTASGKAYAITVEEGAAAGIAPVAAAPVVAPAPAAAPAAVPTPAAAPTGAAGSVQMTAPMPGKVVAVKNAVGQAVKKGDIILVLKAMKMEDDIVTPRDGATASINVSAGGSVESGTVLATLS